MPDLDDYLPSFRDRHLDTSQQKTRRTNINLQDQSVQTAAPSSPPVAGKQQPVAAGRLTDQTREQQNQQNCILLFNLPPVVTNSALVRQRASAKDSLAAATVTAGASLPLMFGAQASAAGQCNCPQLPPAANPQPSPQPQQVVHHHHQPPVMAPQANAVPKNTALRAEHRKQNNMVSVVRPVMSSRVDVAAGQQQSHPSKRLEESSIWSQLQQEADDKQQSVIHDFINLDMKSSRSMRQPPRSQSNGFDLVSSGGQFDDYPTSYEDFLPSAPQLLNEHQARQQMLLFKREQMELNKHLRSQHRFVLAKIEQRKRSLQIIQSVWVQRDFKHAIEKLIDLYQQGLIFATGEEPDRSMRNQCSNTSCSLNSLNTPLVVDVIGIMVLRPKLWTLEICQLLLPIIVNDLLMQEKVQQYENYIEVGLKALKLILSNFSSLIITTLDNDSNSQLASIGGPQQPRCPVDLSAEERVARCLNCARLLVEARNVLAQRSSVMTSSSGAATGRLRPMCRELEQALAAFKTALKERPRSQQQPTLQLFKRPQVGSIT